MSMFILACASCSLVRAAVLGSSFTAWHTLIKVFLIVYTYLNDPLSHIEIAYLLAVVYLKASQNVIN